MSSILPGFKSLSLPGRKVLLRKEGLILGNDVILDGSVVADSGNGLARTSLIRQGNVVCKKTSNGKYYLANDSVNGDRCAPAAVSSTGTGDGTWNSATVTVTIRGGVSLAVALSATTATAAAAVTDLNTAFKNNAFPAVADVSATFVRIRTFEGGADQYISASSSANSFYGAGVTLSGVGTDADYRVIGPGGSPEEIVDLLGPDAAAADAPARNAFAGQFQLSQLLNYTPESQAVLSRRGSLFG